MMGVDTQLRTCGALAEFIYTLGFIRDGSWASSGCVLAPAAQVLCLQLCSSTCAAHLTSPISLLDISVQMWVPFVTMIA